MLKPAAPSSHETLYPNPIQRKVDALARAEFGKFVIKVGDIAPTNPEVMSMPMPDMNTYFMGNEAARQGEVDKMNALAQQLKDPEISQLAKRLEGLSNLKDRVEGIFVESSSPLLAMLPQTQLIAGVAKIGNQKLAAEALANYWASMLEDKLLPERNTTLSVDGLSAVSPKRVQELKTAEALTSYEHGDGFAAYATTLVGDSKAFTVKLGRAQDAFFEKCQNVSGLSAGRGIAG